MLLSEPVNHALRLVNENTNTTVGNLMTDNTETLSTKNAICLAFDECARMIFRNFWAVEKKGTLASVGVGQVLVPLNTLTCETAGFVLWARTSVPSINGTAVPITSRRFIVSQDGNYQNVVNATPTRSYDAGNEAIGLYPAPAGATTLAVRGLVIPPAVGFDLTATVAIGLDDDLVRYLFPRYAAVQLGTQNVQQEDFVARAAKYEAEFMSKCREMYLTIPAHLKSAFPKSQEEALQNAAASIRKR